MLIVAGGGPAQPLQGAIVALRLCKELARPRCVGLTPLTTNADWRYALRFTGAPECCRRATVDGVRATVRPPLGDEGTCEPQVGTWLMSSALRYARCIWQPSGAKGPWEEHVIG